MIGTLNYAGAAHAARADRAYRFEQEQERQSEREKSIEAIAENIMQDAYTGNNGVELLRGNDFYACLFDVHISDGWPIAEEMARDIIDGNITMAQFARRF